MRFTSPAPGSSSPFTWFFDGALPDDVQGPDTERTSSEESDITIRAPSSQPTTARTLPLVELDKFFAVRLLRLEMISAVHRDLELLAIGRALRVALAVAATHAEPIPSGGRTFEAVLGDTLRAFYAWVFGALDDVLLGDDVRPVPEELARELDDLAGAAAALGAFTAPETTLGGSLREIGRASVKLVLRYGRSGR
ncbi:MAG: hypothetical protein ACLQVI_25295 [Polyangiaceae bacterium]